MEDKIKNLLNRAKTAAHIAGDAAGKGLNAATKKGSEIAQSAKLSKKVFDLEGDINVLLQKIGKMVYDTHCGIEADAEALEALLIEVDGKTAELCEAQEELSELKNTRKCTVCGEDVSKDDKFCKNCGAILD